MSCNFIWPNLIECYDGVQFPRSDLKSLIHDYLTTVFSVLWVLKTRGLGLLNMQRLESDKLDFFLKIYLFLNLFYCILNFILFIYFWVLVAARGIFVETCRIFCCGMWTSLQLWHAGSRAHGLCSLWQAGSLVEVRELRSCGTQAQLPRGMWDLSSLTRDRTYIPCIVRWILYHLTTREVPRLDFFNVLPSCFLSPFFCLWLFSPEPLTPRPSACPEALSVSPKLHLPQTFFSLGATLSGLERRQPD